MADYGLIVENASGEIQIDSLYKNYSFAESGTKAIDFLGDESTNKITFSQTVESPLFLIKPPVNFRAGLTWVSTTEAMLGCSTGDSQDVDWMVYQAGPSESTSGYGLLVRNPGGDIVFSSNDEYLKIVGVYSSSGGLSSTVYVTVDDADNNYFFLTDYVFFDDCQDWSPQAERQYFYERSFYRNSSTTIGVQSMYYADYTEPSPCVEDGSSTWGSFQVIEVAPALGA